MNSKWARRRLGTLSLLDHLVRALQARDDEVEGLGGLEGDDQLERPSDSHAPFMFDDVQGSSRRPRQNRSR